MRPENFESLVRRARHRSKREVEALVAELAPQPDVPASVRKLPEPKLLAAIPREPSLNAAEGTTTIARAVHSGASAAALPPSTRTVIAPLSPERYRMQFTVSTSTHQKLRQAQDLLRREIPNGDPDSIIGKALTLLLEDIARRRLAAAAKPRPDCRPSTGSRHVAAHVKRAVWLRDGAQCAFMSARGRRCAERVFLEFHHREPYAIGGEATATNISLRCRAHNEYEAGLVFGATPSNRHTPRRVIGRSPIVAHDATDRRVNSPRGEFQTAPRPPG